MHLAGPTLKTTAIALVATLLIAMQPAAAQRVTEWNPTPVEVQALPQYCQGQFRKELSNNPAYLPSCGGYMNHFCPALVALNRAANFAAPKAGRKYELQLANDHLRYTRSHLPPNCPLLKDIEMAEFRARNLGITLK
jgi:hypothetical protein